MEFKDAEDHPKALNNRLDHISKFKENSVYNENKQQNVLLIHKEWVLGRKKNNSRI